MARTLLLALTLLALPSAGIALGVEAPPLAVPPFETSPPVLGVPPADPGTAPDVVVPVPPSPEIPLGSMPDDLPQPPEEPGAPEHPTMGDAPATQPDGPAFETPPVDAWMGQPEDPGSPLGEPPLGMPLGVPPEVLTPSYGAFPLGSVPPISFGGRDDGVEGPLVAIGDTALVSGGSTYSLASGSSFGVAPEPGTGLLVGAALAALLLARRRGRAG